jgi:hypothetical protein
VPIYLKEFTERAKKDFPDINERIISKAVASVLVPYSMICVPVLDKERLYQQIKDNLNKVVKKKA